jgi:hypothetical protein
MIKILFITLIITIIIIPVIIFLIKKHSDSSKSNDSDEYFAKQNGVMPDVAYIINGNPDGSKNMKRWPNAYKLCNLLGDRLGFECKHLPAKFVTDDDYIKECGDHTDNNKKDKYTRGCTYAHKNAFEQIVKNNKSAIIFEDDIALGDVSIDTTAKHLKKYIEKHCKNVDIGYIGHCFVDKCLHAYYLSVDGARKLLELTEPCKLHMMDLQIADLCNSKKLKCSYAKKNFRNKGTLAEGILKQIAEQSVYH